MIKLEEGGRKKRVVVVVRFERDEDVSERKSVEASLGLGPGPGPGPGSV